MNNNTVIAVDLAKNVFQVFEMKNGSKISYNKQLKRADLLKFMTKQQPTLVAMEACYSSHYWAREFKKCGHTIKLLPAQHVTPFVRGNKSDKNDVVSIAESSLRPNITEVPIKTIEQQGIQSLHRFR